MKTLFINILFLLGLVSCVPSEINSPDKNWDIVSYWEQVKGDSIIVTPIDKIKAEMNIPLEILSEEYQVIKLDNGANLSHRLSDVFISDNYIALSNGSHPLKLFKRDGTFIREIGALGNKKGQYDYVIDVQINEIENQIYILPNHTTGGESNGILVYNLQGIFLQEIPLFNKSMYGSAFKVNSSKDEIIIISSLMQQFPNRYYIWVQDKNGNFKYGLYPGHKKTDLYCAQNVLSLNHTESMETFLLYGGNGTLYNGEINEEYLSHYNKEENRLIPKFRVLTQNNGIFIYELPFYYIVEEGMDSYRGIEHIQANKSIIDKRTLKSCRFSGFITPEGLLLDQYDILFKTHDGYFSLVEQESQILERIQRINKKDLTKKQKEGLDKLQHMIEEDAEDGFLLFMAKFKTKE